MTAAVILISSPVGDVQHAARPPVRRLHAAQRTNAYGATCTLFGKLFQEALHLTGASQTCCLFPPLHHLLRHLCSQWNAYVCSRQFIQGKSNVNLWATWQIKKLLKVDLASVTFFFLSIVLPFSFREASIQQSTVNYIQCKLQALAIGHWQCGTNGFAIAFISYWLNSWEEWNYNGHGNGELRIQSSACLSHCLPTEDGGFCSHRWSFSSRAIKAHD